jgi:multidrug efflux pump subunit AcrB
MWIVRLALRRPYTFVVVSLLMLLFGIGTCVEAPKDIYPYINIPVVTIVWSYTGLPPRGDGRPDRYGLRARADDDGQ